MDIAFKTRSTKNINIAREIIEISIVITCTLQVIHNSKSYSFVHFYTPSLNERKISELVITRLAYIIYITYMDKYRKSLVIFFPSHIYCSYFNAKTWEYLM